MNLRSELEVARVARARNRTKCRGTEAAIEITERRHIRKFEYLGSKLEVYSLGDSEDFPEHQVGILQYGDTLFTLGLNRYAVSETEISIKTRQSRSTSPSHM